MKSRSIRAVAVLCGLLLLTAGCEPLDDPAAAPPADPNVVGGKTAALTQLDGLTVSTWAASTGYDRDLFPTWSAQGEDCDTRDVVLQRDGQSVKTGAECKITQGSWFSVYDGKTVTDPKDLDIDHMVPLANAWRTGAKDWSTEQREQFANDLTNPQLLAVSLSTNRSKGDRDPAEWKPPRREYWCEYAQRWIAVKGYWKLHVRAVEKTALEEMLATCA
jgi:hypothetical protein